MRPVRICVSFFSLAFVAGISVAADSTNGDDKTIFNRLAEAGFTLQRASTGPDKTEPAEFGFVDDINNSTEFHANFFLHYRPVSLQPGYITISPSASVEGNLSTADTTTQDAWRFRGGTEFDIPFGPKVNTIQDPLDPTFSVRVPDNELFASIDAKYESDRDFRASKVTAEFVVTPTIPSWAMGRYAPIFSAHSDNGVRFRWRPFLQLDAGHTFDPGVNSKETNETLLRIRPRIRAELTFDVLKKALRMKGATAFADFEYVSLPLETAQNDHHYLTTGIDLQLTDNVGFGFTFSTGEQAPDFAHENRLSGQITIGFGKE